MLKQKGGEAIAARNDADALGDVDEVDVFGDVDHPSEEPVAPASPVAAGLCKGCGARLTLRARVPRLNLCVGWRSESGRIH